MLLEKNEAENFFTASIDYLFIPPWTYIQPNELLFWAFSLKALISLYYHWLHRIIRKEVK